MYMFHNERYDIQFFTRADGWNEAMMKFDVANFPNRDDWNIFKHVVINQQEVNNE